MKTAAIICEYNPFHFGHEYQICELRREISEETVVISVMSGSFTQRGEPAVYGKYVRARAAVSCGSDLVVELPAPWSMAGAEFFARGGVSIAKKLGVDYLVFGGESELETLKTAAENLDSDEFRREFLIEKDKFPSDSMSSIRERTYKRLYSSPLFAGSNDILALEYLRALNRSEVEPFCIKRVGEKHNPDGNILSDMPNFSSASTIREKILNGVFPAGLMPERTAEIFRDSDLHRTSNLDSIVTAYLRFFEGEMPGIEISGGIENRLKRAAERNFGVDKIIEASVERRFSASRIRRAIFGAICGFDAKEYESEPEFTQILAANQRGRGFLSAIRKKCELCILTKPANFNRLPEKAKKQFESSVRAESLWALSADDESKRRADELLRAVPYIEN